MVKLYLPLLTSRNGKPTQVVTTWVGLKSALFGFLCLISPQLFAHGGVAMDKDTCAFRAKGYLLHFTAYQPEETQTKELCRSIVESTDTIIVLDLIDESLRTLPLHLGIEKRQNETYIPYLTLPENVYPAGTTNFKLSDITEGDYRVKISTHQTGKHSHDTKGMNHDAGYFNFSVSSRKSYEKSKIYQQYSWVIYLIGLGLLLYFLSDRYRSR